MKHKTVAVTFNKHIFCHGPCGPHNLAMEYDKIIDWNTVYIAKASQPGQFWDFNVQVGTVVVPAQFDELTSIFHKNLWIWLRRERLSHDIQAVQAERKRLNAIETKLKREQRSNA
jgi:hypothetical protein